MSELLVTWMLLTLVYNEIVYHFNGNFVNLTRLIFFIFKNIGLNLTVYENFLHFSIKKVPNIWRHLWEVSKLYNGACTNDTSSDVTGGFANLSEKHISNQKKGLRTKCLITDNNILQFSSWRGTTIYPSRNILYPRYI